MELITIKPNKTFNLPERHQITKENRKLVIKTEFSTTIEKLLKGDVQITTQFWNLEKPRKTHKDLIEINGEFFKVLRPLEVRKR